MTTLKPADKQKVPRLTLVLLFFVLFGAAFLARPSLAYGFNFDAGWFHKEPKDLITDFSSWLSNLFQYNNNANVNQDTNTNTSWVKDFLARNPGYKEQDIVKRDKYSIHFKRPDGTIEAEILQSPIHYKDDQGQWQALDTAITASNDSQYDYQNITNSFKTFFSSNAYQDNGNIKLVKGDASLTIKTIDKLAFTDRNEILTLSDLRPKTRKEIQAKKGVVDKQEQNKICYPKLYEKQGKTIDVCYIVKEGRIQEQLILNQYQGYPELTQTITLTNAYAKKEGKQITFYHTQTNELLWYILDPVIYEQKDLVENRDLHYDLTCNQANTPLNKCSDLSITKILEPKAKEYLADPQRQYPVVIDPDFAESTADGYVEARTTGSYGTAYNTSSGFDITLNKIYVGQYFDDPGYVIYRGYLKFDTSAIPDTDSVTQVNLKMVCTDDYSTDNFNIVIKKQDWSVQDPITASTREAAYDNCITADADDNIWRSTSGMAMNTQYASGNLNTVWVNKTGNTYYSLISSENVAVSAPTGSEFIYIASQDHATAAYRPILTVVYTAPKANGEACTLGSECTSTYCADSVCCNTACTDSTCQRCDSYSNAGAGTCGYISTAVDPDSECGALDCDGGATKYYDGWTSSTCYYKADVSAANAVCAGTSLACKTEAVQCAASTQGLTSGVTRTACKTQLGCTGTTVGSLGNESAGSDTNNDCSSYGCTSKVYGWSSLNCTAATAAANDGMCNGSGSCYTSFADSCTSGGSILASCGSAGCQKAGVCVQDTASTTSDTVGEICYTSEQNSCSANYVCNASGTCQIPDCLSVPMSGNHSLASACAFPGTINGVDAGTGSANTAKLTVGAGGSLTILSDQTVAVGSLELSGGSITIIEGGVIKIRTPLYLPDADSDGYPTSVTTTQYTSAGANRARRSAGTDYNDASASVYPGTACNGVCSVNSTSGTCDAVSAGKNGLSTCHYCDGSSLSEAHMASGSDTYSECTASTNCGGNNCNGSGACDALAANTSGTTGGSTAYCDNSNRLWTPTAVIGGSATTYLWGGYGTDEPSNSCIGIASRPACNYCDDLTYAGYTDWVLPTSAVLTAFWTTPCGAISCGSGNAGVAWDATAQATAYYSSTEYDGSYVWYVYFNLGIVEYGSKTFPFNVRCVRGQ